MKEEKKAEEILKDVFEEDKNIKESLKNDLKEIKESHSKIDYEYKASIEKEVKKGYEDSLKKEYEKKMDKALDEMEERFKNKTLEFQSKVVEEDKIEKEGEVPYDYKKNFMDYLRGNIGDSEFKNASDKYRKKASGDLSSYSEPLGGFLVHPAMEKKVTKRMFETSPLRMLADVKTISTDRYEFLTDFIDAEVLTQNEQANSPFNQNTQSVQYKKHQIDVHDYSAQPLISQSLLEDAYINIEKEVTEKVADKFMREQNLHFITGDGVSQPKGLSHYVQSGDTFDQTDALQIEKIEYTDSADLDDIIDLESALFYQYQSNAKFLISRESKSFLRKLKDNDGRYLLSMDYWGGFGGLKGENAPTMMMLGKPCYEMNDLGNLQSGGSESAGTVSIYYGDFKKGYCIVDRIGMYMIKDYYTSKPNLLLYMRKRTGAGVVNGQCLKALVKA